MPSTIIPVIIMGHKPLKFIAITEAPLTNLSNPPLQANENSATPGTEPYEIQGLQSALNPMGDI